jgi:hypothetical protein
MSYKRWLPLLVIFLSIKTIAATRLKTTITVNQNSFDKALVFERDNYFSASFYYDFSGLTHLKKLTVSSETLPANYLKVGARQHDNTITVTLNYQDPFFTPLDFNTIDFPQIKLLLDNESPLFIDTLFSGLADKIKSELLAQIYQELNPRIFQHYQDNFYTGIIRISRTSSINALKLLQVIKQTNNGSEDKLAIVNMVLGYANVEEIHTMKKAVAGNSDLKAFITRLHQQFNDNQILKYLIST